MIFDSKAGKIVLFGGGRSLSGGDFTTVSLAFDDTWEYDGAGATWTKRATTGGPSARVDFGFAYSSQTNKAYLFGGLEITSAGVDGTPTQDSWEWDGAAGTWTERTSTGSKPSPRFGHAMAVNSSKGQAVIFGGYDMITGGSLNDVWYWDLAAGTWAGTEPPGGTTWPAQRQWASLVVDTSTSKVYLVAGLVNDQGSYGGYGGTGGSTGYYPVTGGSTGIYLGTGGTYGGPYIPAYPSSSYGATREVWELNPATTTWVDRSAPANSPGARYSYAMAADQVSGKVYLFGGQDTMGNLLNDLWEWNGDKWAECPADITPTARTEAALAYDPARKSLVLFGGSSYGGYDYYGMTNVLADTWEWNLGTRKWNQLSPTVSPSKRSQHGMVTDSARKKILLYGGYDTSSYITYYPYPPYPYYVDAGVYSDPIKNDVWEWDGASTTWTNRTPTLPVAMPTGRSNPTMVFDEGRKKLTLLEAESGYGWLTGDFWEWDPETGAWSLKKTGDTPGSGLSGAIVAYDSIRRRLVILGVEATSSSYTPSTWELDTSVPTWYRRDTATVPSETQSVPLAFDNQRGVVVFFGGVSMGMQTDETWEYSVTGRGNGTGCTAATAAQCSSGNCVDGVCCESASCTGPCKSCNVSGKVGTCVLASPGTQVAGSCSGDQACDGTGACKAANGTACTAGSACASGFCTDGVCCGSACTGLCVSCKLAGKLGTCSPFPIGTDPEGDCSKGTPPCQSTCDGIGACVFPAQTSCGACGTCNYAGTCVESLYCTTPSTATRTSSLTTTATKTSTPITSTGTATSTLTAPTGTATSTLTVRTSTGTTTSTGTGLTVTRTASSTGTSVTSTGTGTSATGTVTTTSTRTTGTGSDTGSRTGTGTSTALVTSSGTGTALVTSSGTGTAIVTSSSTQTGTGSPTNTGGNTVTGATTDTGSTSRDGGATGRKDGSIGDSGTAAKLGHSGCDCDLGNAPAGGSGLTSVLGLLGAILVWLRTRKRQ